MIPTYSIFVSLARDLEEHERKNIFEALYETVPGNGFVANYKMKNQNEVFFVLDAPFEEIAHEKANEYMKWVLQKSKIEVDFTIDVSINPMTYKN